MTWLGVLLLLQSSVVLNPQYRVGEEELWQMSLAFGTEYGDIELGMSVVRKVRSMESTGDIEFEYVFKDLKVMVNGEEQEAQPLPAHVLRMTNQGLPVGQKTDPPADSLDMKFFYYLHLLPQKEWYIGERVSVSLKDPGNPKTEVRGEMVAESLEKNELKTVSHLDLAIEGFAKPLRLVRKAWFEVSSGRLVRAEGTVSNLPLVRGIGEVQAIQYRYEWVKAIKKEGGI
ncbi:MAG: hypothetical protein K6T17_01545 [Fimbriimonadales bacterium]|nr:hypothetical protein [Fimbriimonadales bacterium]